MIYQLVQYLRNTFPAETIYINQRPPAGAIPDRNTLVKETGGVPQAWTKYTQATFQILSRDVDTPKARALAWMIFTDITDRFGLILPVATVDGIIYNELQSAQITAIQEPESIGADEEGRSIFSTNYKVIYTRN